MCCPQQDHETRIKIRNCQETNQSWCHNEKEIKPYENNKNPEYLKDQPPIARDAVVKYQQFSLGPSYIIHYIVRIGIDALNSFSLLGHHVCQLGEDLPKLCDRCLDRFNGRRPLLNVGVLEKALWEFWRV